MLAFVDESGDPGLKLGKGSSPFFVVAVVTFEEHDEADAVDKRITLLRRELRWHPNHEFMFHGCSRKVRLAFLNAVNPYRFSYVGSVIDKEPWKNRFHDKRSLYREAIVRVFRSARPYLRRADVVLDGAASREFQRELGTYIRREINDRGQTCIARMRVRDSSSNNLLQLADMVVGAISRSFRGEEDSNEYRGVLASHEMSVQCWPKR